SPARDSDSGATAWRPSPSWPPARFSSGAVWRRLTAMGNWHRLRKKIHAACFAAFLALPFLNLVRFDIPRQRFYFAGYELWINEFAIIFFALMFLMFLVVASSVVYGRVYCGYMCPQMIFSEAAAAAEDWLKRKINKKFPGLKPKQKLFAWRASAYLAIGAASV